jgi:phosphate transport system substrate-binding protein
VPACPPDDGPDKEIRVKKRTCLALLGALVVAFGVAACGDDEEENGGGGGGGELSGNIRIDGSSTVQPFAEAAAELFNEENPNVRITVGGAGTGDGFEKFCRGETQVSDASRPIEAEEKQACSEGNVQPVEVQVASDGITVATHKDLTVDCMTTDQLKQVFNKGANVTNLNQVDPKFPDQELALFTPGTESGTFDFFTEEINGEEGVQRTEGVQTSADDNVLVTGVSGEEGGFGYFGFSFYDQNKDKLNAVAVDGGDGCVKPSVDTIQNGDYKPLSRSLFMYPSRKALQQPEVREFLTFAVQNHQEIAEAAQIVPMPNSAAQKSMQTLGG